MKNSRSKEIFFNFDKACFKMRLITTIQLTMLCFTSKVIQPTIKQAAYEHEKSLQGKILGLQQR